MEKLVKKLNISENPFIFTDKLSIKKLETLIDYTNNKYRIGESVITDALWDMLVDFLRLKNPKSKILKQIGAKVKSKERVKLPYYLGSMDKIKPPSNKIDKWKKKHEKPYILSEKLDGVSGLLVYTTDKEIKLYTRGTATHGMDITRLLKYIPNIPTHNDILEYSEKNNFESEKEVMAFRGELIIPKRKFEKHWADKMKNPRNTVSGLVNSKNINPKLASDTRFVVYEVVDPFFKISKQFEIIKELNFNRVHNKMVSDVNYEYLSKYLVKRKKTSKYEIDGIIVTNNKLHKRNEKGNPKYAFAFKDVLEEQKAITKIIDIIWKKSKDGYINPTIIIEPVEIGGVTIKRATAFNAKFVQDNMLGKGAVIEIIRSGDVIPKIERVITKAKKLDMPKGDWEWSKSGVDIITKDLYCKDVRMKNIHHFFFTLETKGLGERIVEKLYDTGINTIEKILNMSNNPTGINELLKVEGFKEKSSTNLINSIKKSTSDVPLALLMKASNKLGHGMGIRRVQSILNVYPDIIKKYHSWTKEEFILNLKELDGWNDITSNMFVNNFKKFIDFYNKIKKYITIIEPKKKTKKGKYKDMKIVLSGFRDKELKEYLENEGATITNTISKNTDLLIIKDKNVKETSKVKKAKELDVSIKTKNDIVF